MIESYQPRSGIAVQGSAGATIGGDEAPDWVHRRRPSARSPSASTCPVDREYACVFKLVDHGTRATAIRTTRATRRRTSRRATAPRRAWRHDAALPPTRLRSRRQNPLQQDYAKAYPTIRELLLAAEAGRPGHRVVDLPDPPRPTTPPATTRSTGIGPRSPSIVDRLEVVADADVLARDTGRKRRGRRAVPGARDPAERDGSRRLAVHRTSRCTRAWPRCDPTILSEFQADQHAAAAQNGGGDRLVQLTTCQIQQVLPANFTNGTCQNNTGTAPGDQGWCYLTGQRTCPQALQFSTNGLPSGGVVSLQCLENSSDFASGNGAGGTSATFATGGDAGAP